MRYEAVIGLEIHAQMLTDSKIFCGCSTKFGAEPNSQTCPVCTGMPGVLPVLNKRVVEYAIKAGLALDCDISRHSRFARKNYFYPDLPKGYQISQYELPICENGHIDIVTEGKSRKVGITRIHMEEDAGKNLHGSEKGYSYVDLNRTGVPLIEIVTEPDIRTPAEAAVFMRTLRSIVRYLGVCDGNMEQGSLRCDANVSVRPEGADELGTKAEIKNINSFRFVEKAVEYEIKRQISVIEDGGSVVQETRLFDSEKGTTHSMRSKEEAHDYRYFPDPDLVPLEVSEDWIAEIRRAMPELPGQKKDRFMREIGLPEHDADILSEERDVAEWFEHVIKEGADAKSAANWMINELLRLVGDEGIQVSESKVKPDQLARMLVLIDDGTIIGKIAKKVFSKMYETGMEHGKIVEEEGLEQISDSSELEGIVDKVLGSNPDEVERFKGGDHKLMGFFVGHIMKETKGKANPKLVNELIRKKMGS
ncbi:MAG: Asp-tRNA(Asn)/Glu-tRNA(Gln) amidotransferase subunit GatB [Nitrospirota bacterium]|nr:MAG: Asp-tRNA(Asn)/Glu-tRNA(Gln) amidotransferase subunit GatB [Nitrospirota bacterium]